MKRAFTLIEVLVVVCIIGLLAAILYPVFSRVREGARKSVCQSNLRQIGLGLHQYISDYDDVLPSSVYYMGNVETSGISHYWRDAIYPYIRVEGVFNCPSDRSLQPFSKYKFTGIPSTNSQTHGSYWCNGAYPDSTKFNGPCWPSIHRGIFKTQKSNAIQDPATTIWTGDSAGRRASFIFNSPLQVGVTTANGFKGYKYLRVNTDNEGIIAWHHDKALLQFMDGHVKAYNIENLNDSHIVSNVVYAKWWTIQAD